MPTGSVFRQFVLKVHSRCDLACDHCYVFEHADQSWRGRSNEMAVATMAQAARRIADHAERHGLAEVGVILHGGEPLLAGPAHLADLIAALRVPLERVCRVDLRLHTNGVLLDRRFCDLLRAEGVRVGISLDGDREANDRHRRYRDGRSSYDKAVRAIELLRAEYPELYSGILCTIDVANDPTAVYEALVSHGPPAIDFLWPHHTWDRPPPRASATAYADWLAVIADRWLADGRPVAVRMFDSIISTGRGGASFTESLGLEATDLLVVETDGEYELADSLKTAYQGAPDTGMDVFGHAVDDVADHPGIRARQGGTAALCEKCRECPVVSTCGGGLFAHRHSEATGFANPSVYCDDLLAVIRHVQRRTTRASQELSLDTLMSLATGYGDPPAIAQLKSAQTTGNRTLIARVGGRTAPSEAWTLLNRIGSAHPEALDSALAHPYIRAWAVHRLRKSGDLASGPGGHALPPGPPDDGLLATVACVAAARAGVAATLTVPVQEGAIYFPAVGRYEVPGRTSTTVEVGDGELHVANAERVEYVRYLTAGTFSVALDDLDPFRDCHDWPAAGRLDQRRFEEWQAAFQDAWALLEKQYAEYAPSITQALTTIVPLEAPGGGRSVSSAARDAFGSVGIALPESPALLCLLLLHEFQHVKLGAVLDFADLYDRHDDRTYHAPWRADPRPLEGLLQGTYAHIAVADFWLRRTRSPEPADEALRHFHDWYPKTLAATRTLQTSGALTGLGEQFVASMRRTLESWPAPEEYQAVRTTGT
ncbi:FxsB family cyclophane-forming radical SAM/SPASM peptide maturase [Actinomadura sp. NEAU-AAG7]|uniref:FxsB family radical SAM/SPASM domain protein n=1 Tax=Actinomadura litoris TaxID=2678616 RepID=A0A7K1KY60_9ACTN|nr:FxsB family cyclophane-forming radical SAM/SPASM peptide maturase [Actinomadura sp. NEAU-AAG7]MBT2209045.1 FxsB family radical SAM/SPASM domain protein [Actinomadura sp. NEAU-AAG7]MUN37138.1 FxsB family radical SAM/SPASM domain protein [Actinomadura litoris]